MLATGTIDPVNKTFDITGLEETQTSIAVINTTVRLSYRSPEGELVQLTKQIQTASDTVGVGDVIQLSQATENGLKGYAQKSIDGTGVAKALTSVDWTDTSKLTTKYFVDDAGQNRVAVLLPVVMHNV